MVKLAAFMLFVVSATGACAAVAGIDSPTPRNGDGGTDATTGATYPRSCAQARAAGASTDGMYTIDPDGTGPNPPFAVYCYQMNTVEPTEYLELPANVEAGLDGANVSGFAPGGNACGCPAINLAFTKVRIDPTTLRVEQSDRTFAFFETDARCPTWTAFNPIADPIFGYAVAGSCDNYGDTSGQGNMDLAGTPFHVSPSTVFAPSGPGAACIATASPDRKRIDLQGGGYWGLCEVPRDAGGVALAFDVVADN